MSPSKKEIVITLAGREYPIFISEDSEAFIRKTVEKINEEVLSLKENYQGDMQDFLAMYLLMHITQLETSKQEEQSDLSAQLDSIIRLLDKPMD